MQLTNVDDLGPGATFGSLSFTGGGYSISAASGSTASFTSIDSAQTSNPNVFDVPLALSQATIVTVDNSGESLTLGGVISGSDGITTAGSGTVDLTADNTYTGDTAVTAGTLLVDGNQSASAVTVSTGATLGGMGTVASVSATGGTITPGNPAPGILTDAGALSLEADTSSNNSTFKVVLDGTTPGNGTGNYSQLQAAGPIALSGATLSATLGNDFVPAVGSTYTILDNTGSSTITGTFDGQAALVDRTDLGNAVPDQLCRRHGQQLELGRFDRARSEHDDGDAHSGFAGLRPVGCAHGNRHRSHRIDAPPTGSVQFFNGATSLGTEVLANGSDSVTLNVTTLPVASNSITAQYSGDSNFAGSTSPAVTVAVAKSASTTTLTPSTTTPVFGESVTFTATVLPVSPGAGMPTGTVQFFNGTNTLGTETLSCGTASIPTSTLALGANSITVQYSGDTNFTGQTSLSHHGDCWAGFDIGDPLYNAKLAGFRAGGHAHGRRGRRQPRHRNAHGNGRVHARLDNARLSDTRQRRGQYHDIKFAGGHRHDFDGLFGRYRLHGRHVDGHGHDRPVDDFDDRDGFEYEPGGDSIGHDHSNGFSNQPGRGRADRHGRIPE